MLAAYYTIHTGTWLLFAAIVAAAVTSEIRHNRRLNMNMCANIVTDEQDAKDMIADWVAEALEVGKCTVDGHAFFDEPMQIWDPDDPLDGPLAIVNADPSGDGMTVLAERCADVNELERRVVRCLGDSWTIDDSWTV